MTRISTEDEEKFQEQQRRLNTIHRNMMLKCGGDDSNCTTGPPAPPYPFCRTPEKCTGKGYCPADIACND